MQAGQAAKTRSRWQIRPTVAKLQNLLTLRIRLALLVALVVSVVVSLSAYLEMQSFESAATTQLIDTAKSTAESLAEYIEVQDADIVRDPAEVADILRSFGESVPSIRRISLVTIDSTTGKPAVYASTSTSESRETMRVAARAINDKAETWGDRSQVLQVVAVPTYFETEILGSVAVTFSLGSVQQVRTTGKSVVFWFTPPAIIALTLLVDLLSRRLIHKPIAGIRKTMQRVAAGDLSARAPIARKDEIGAVAQGLNEMLAEMENFNVALQTRVREATEGLRASNAQLIDSYQRMFALREALSRAEQMAAVGQTAASVAHQIGTPLNLISGYVQMLMEEAGENSRMSRRLEIVQEQITKVTTIVRTMLDHARRPAPRQSTSVTQMVQHVCELARPKLDTSGVKLTLKVADDVPPVTADGVQLELALLNLITNSLDAMPSGGELTISVTPTVSGVRIEVADTGTGIEADLLPKVFDPWVTTKAAGRGSGLGLSITRDVVTAHGGTIAAASDFGSGSTFTIELPRAVEGTAEQGIA